MERVVVLDLITYLQSNNLINKQQLGFLKKRCTATNLLESLSDWTLNIENGRRQAVAYIDFDKAFDIIIIIITEIFEWLKQQRHHEDRYSQSKYKQYQKMLYNSSGISMSSNGTRRLTGTERR